MKIPANQLWWYFNTGHQAGWRGIAVLELKTPREIEAMRVTGAFIAELLDDLAYRGQPGANLFDLEHRAR